MSFVMTRDGRRLDARSALPTRQTDQERGTRESDSEGDDSLTAQLLLQDVENSLRGRENSEGSESPSVEHRRTVDEDLKLAVGPAHDFNVRVQLPLHACRHTDGVQSRNSMAQERISMRGTLLFAAVWGMNVDGSLRGRDDLGGTRRRERH
jgi:hypothetical protein